MDGRVTIWACSAKRYIVIHVTFVRRIVQKTGPLLVDLLRMLGLLFQCIDVNALCLIGDSAFDQLAPNITH